LDIPRARHVRKLPPQAYLLQMTILTLANSKGGGGNTTIAACFAAELTRREKQEIH